VKTDRNTTFLFCVNVTPSCQRTCPVSRDTIPVRLVKRRDRLVITPALYSRGRSFKFLTEDRPTPIDVFRGFLHSLRASVGIVSEMLPLPISSSFWRDTSRTADSGST
jgi:hypothetical protein